MDAAVVSPIRLRGRPSNHRFTPRGLCLQCPQRLFQITLEVFNKQSGSAVRRLYSTCQAIHSSIETLPLRCFHISVARVFNYCACASCLCICSARG